MLRASEGFAAFIKSLSLPPELTSVTEFGEGIARSADDDAVESSDRQPLFPQSPNFGVYEELQMYRDLFERLPIAVYIKDRDSQIIDVNPFNADALGMKRHDMIGRSDEDLYPEVEAELYRRADQRVIEEGTDISGLSENHTGFNGTVVQHRTWKFPVRDSVGEVVGLMGFSYGVTESSAALEELKRSELRYALAARASRDGIWEFSIDSRTVLMTPRASQLLGLPIAVEPVALDDVYAALSDDDQEQLEAKLELLIEAPKEIVEQTLRITVDARPRWLELRFLAFTEGGNVTRLIGTIADVTDSQERLAQLDYYAHHDALTGLGNRRALQRKLSTALSCTSNGESTPQHLSLICLDLDSFKVINDSLGHLAGDAMLYVVSERLKEFSKELRGTCMVTRYGGDEFALVLEGCAPAEVEAFAHSVVRRLKEPTTLLGLEVYPSASVGVVHVHDQGDATDVLRDADIAMYRAKSLGKSRAMIFHSGMRQDAQATLNEQTSIRRAVDSGTFVLVYQPVISAASGGIAGFEALIRLQGPNGEMVRPALFLEYLESSDLILEVGRWVAEQAVSDLSSWRESFPQFSELAMSINVSRRQFADDGLFEWISEVLGRHDVPAHALILEITETAVANNGVDLPSLQGFRSSGGLVAIDDFGTGQSSLFALNELPVDILKLDRSFTARIGPSGVDPMLEATFDFVRSLDVRLVAEGVEEAHQADWLRQRGTHFLQGYHFAKPMPEAHVREYLDVASKRGLTDAA